MIDGLTNGTTYEVQVKAQNIFGEGPWTAAFTGTPTAAARNPGQPTGFIVFVVVMDDLRQKADEYHPAGGPAADTEHIAFRPADSLEVEQDLSWTVAAAVGRRYYCRLLQFSQSARIRPHRCAASLSSSASRSSSSSSSAARSYEVVVRLWETVAQLSHAKYLHTAVLRQLRQFVHYRPYARAHARTDG